MSDEDGDDDVVGLKRGEDSIPSPEKGYVAEGMIQTTIPTTKVLMKGPANHTDVYVCVCDKVPCVLVVYMSNRIGTNTRRPSVQDERNQR